jgi:hypothetical protein
MAQELVTRLIRHLGPALAHETLGNGISQIVNQLNLDNAPRLIGFCGAAGAGKDTASFLLSFLGYQKLAFADALKIEAYDSITNPTEEYQARVREELGINLPFALDVATADYDKVDIINRRKVELRRLLQWHGTEYRRAQDKDYWINRVREKVKTGKWVVSDVRFQNEVAMIREEGGQVWLITGRDDGYTPTHASETDWKDTTFDATFENGGDITILQNALYRNIFDRKVMAQ